MTDIKDRVREFFEAANQEGMEALRRFAWPDMTFWAPGVEEISLDAYLDLVGGITPLLSAPLHFTVIDIIVEGNRAAAEIESYAPLKNGKIYNNKYNFKIIFRDDKIAAIREYANTQHIAETFDMADLGASEFGG